MASFTLYSMNNRRNTVQTHGNVLQAELSGPHLHHNSRLALYSAGPTELAAAEGAFQRGHSHYTETFLSLNFKTEWADLKWYGVGKWWNCNFRYKIPSIMCMRKHSHSVEQICLLRVIFGWRAGTNLILGFLWAVGALEIIWAQRTPFANGETKV